MLSGTTKKEIREYERKHKQVALKAAEESMVLLKNEEILPIKKGLRVELYGSGARQTRKGGTGSGDVNAREVINVEQGLEEIGFTIVTKSWLDEYDAIYQEAREEWKRAIRKKEKEENQEFILAYFDTPFKNPEENLIQEEVKSDIVIYVLSRISGEGTDRRNEKGDFLLSDSERANLEWLKQHGKTVLLVLNTGGMIDLSFLDEMPNIKAVLYMMQSGMEIGRAFANLLVGEITPSGKLVDTWGASYEEWNCYDTFGANNGDVNTEYYTEGIYVGYRWFDAMNKKVRYPFGYGLSYTSFSIKPKEVMVEDGACKISVLVQNIGDTYQGKEVVQLYCKLPQKEDIEREKKKLVAFAKTKCLKPQEQTELILTFPLHELERFEEETGCFLIDSGEYQIGVGTSYEKEQTVAILQVEQNLLLEKVNHICPKQKELKEMKVKEVHSNDLSTKEKKEDLESWLTEEQKANITISIEQSQLEMIRNKRKGTYIKTNEEDQEIIKDTEKIVSQMTLNQKVEFVCGFTGSDSMAGAASHSVPGAAGETVAFSLENGVSVPNIILADGPAGLRIAKEYEVDQDGNIYQQDIESAIENGFFAPKEVHKGATTYYQYCTAFPIGTALAQTWNLDLVEQVGSAVGEEMKEFGITLWLAPGMNIHRNPLCGRNFEYFSEDPLLTGKIAASMTKGVQAIKGIGTTIKHFACNNQEDNRLGVDCIVSERALREIYLKGFEIAIKESQPFAIMTSYNKINGVYSANNKDLCTEVARKEWGFEGIIMTDWTTTVNGAKSYRCMQAGNDLIMPGMKQDHENIKEALQKGILAEDELNQCVTRLVKFVLKCTKEKSA